MPSPTSGRRQSSRPPWAGRARHRVRRPSHGPRGGDRDRARRRLRGPAPHLEFAESARPCSSNAPDSAAIHGSSGANHRRILKAQAASHAAPHRRRQPSGRMRTIESPWRWRSPPVRRPSHGPRSGDNDRAQRRLHRPSLHLEWVQILGCGSFASLGNRSDFDRLRRGSSTDERHDAVRRVRVSWGIPR